MSWNCGRLFSMESAKSSSEEKEKLLLAVKAKEDGVQVLRARLNETVEELTAANLLESNYLKEQKHFVHFLYQLSLAQNLEELFLIASEQFQMNTSLKPSIFITQYQLTEAKFHEVDGHHVRVKFGEGLQTGSHFGVMPEEVTQRLANFLGRPLGTVYFFKTYLPTIRKFVPELEFFILFESFNVVKPEDFVARLKSYVDVMSLVLDRQMLRYHSRAYVSAWEKTFDHFKDPICIKDFNGVVIRSNAAFQKELKLMDDYEIQSHHLLDPKTKAPRATIELYVNKTEFEELRKQQVLSEKMTALGRLAGNIAHELNNPLSGILSMSQILKSELTDEVYKKVREDIDELQKATVRCQKIISDLTQFSLGEVTEHQDYRTSADEAIDVVLSLLKSALRRHHVRVDLKTKNYWLDIPPQLFQQVMFNLINNACQAMEDGGQLEIQTQITEEQGEEICQVSILDSGPGISEEVGPKIFEPFFTTKAKGVGTGLGLHLSKMIVEKYKGRLQFETKTGDHSRTKFIVQLPVRGSIV